MFVCRLAIEIGFDFSIFELNINVQERNRSCRSFTSELDFCNKCLWCGEFLFGLLGL